MLLRRMSSRPKMIAGLRIAWDSPVVLSDRSTSALPRKYGSAESSAAFVMLTCTTRRTPAARAARKSVSELRAATSWVRPPLANRIQYVLNSVSTPSRLRVRAPGSSKL